ncbi:MAG: hypothetical protein IH587_07710 [Anaerolineae bacterium]|nr:hypothetical protein [Anaerolineae bacterium]
MSVTTFRLNRKPVPAPTLPRDWAALDDLVPPRCCLRSEQGNFRFKMRSVSSRQMIFALWTGGI